MKNRYKQPNAERRKRDPQKLGDIVSQLMARRGYSQVSSIDELRSAWIRVAGPLANDSLPGNIKRGVLEIVVRSSVMVQELTFRKKQLLSQLIQQVPGEKIKDIRFKVGTID
ncbi:MAG: DUF721 domain-containing protein [Pirellulaceae bacterium]|nr:DUF721 domain-containing protein [Planctomycetales bacterium]